MLFREKLLILIMVIVAYVYMLDHITPWGNQYWELKSSNNDRYAVWQKGKIGFINARGRLVIPLVYEEAVNYSLEGLILVKNQGAWGFIDHEGEVKIPFKYRWAKSFSEGLAAVSQDEFGKLSPVFGFINEKGQEIIPLNYDEVKSFTKEALAAVKKDSRWGYINTQGVLIIPSVFDDASEFSEKIAAVKFKNNWGYINLGGQWIIEPQFQEAGRFSHGIAPVKKEGLWGYIDTAGHWVIDPQYTQAHELSHDEGLGVIQNDEGVGFINQDGIVVFYSKQWRQAKDFSEGLAAVKLSSDIDNPELGKWGYINTKGILVIKNIFNIAGDFHGGLARVSLEKNNLQRGYVNSKGLLVWDPADWQQSSIWNHRIHIVLIAGITFYLFLLTRYIFWWASVKKKDQE